MVFGWSGSALFADIYVWTDANGVKNFTNNAPPEQAVVFMETPEIDVHSPIMQTAIEKEREEADDLRSQQLRAAQDEIEALSEQVAGLRNELRDALEPVYEPPPVEPNEVIESPNRVIYRPVIGYGFYPRYDPYGYLWYHKVKKHQLRPRVKKHHQRTRFGYGGHKKLIPHKSRLTHNNSKKRFNRHGVRADKHRSGYRKTHSIRHRSVGGGSTRRHSGGYRGGMSRRR